MVPSEVTESVLTNSAAYRGRQRLPTATWRHRETGAILVRCAQPLPGVGGKRSGDDEDLVNAIRKTAANQEQVRDGV